MTTIQRGSATGRSDKQPQIAHAADAALRQRLTLPPAVSYGSSPNALSAFGDPVAHKPASATGDRPTGGSTSGNGGTGPSDLKLLAKSQETGVAAPAILNGPALLPFGFDRSFLLGGFPTLPPLGGTLKEDLKSHGFDSTSLTRLPDWSSPLALILGFLPASPASPPSPAVVPAPVTPLPKPITPAPRPKPTPQPVQPAPIDTYLYGPKGGGQPHASDIKQDEFGDCYFVATLSAIAATHPRTITDAIKQTPDCNYEVSLYAIDANHQPVTDASGHPVQMTMKVTRAEVEDNIARGGGSLLDNTADHSGAAWPALMEVAYAKMRAKLDLNSQDLNAGYNLIANGGYISDALYTITGKDGAAYAIDQSDAAAVATEIKRALGNRQAVVIGTWEEAAGTPADGLVDGHAYEVVGVEVDTKGETWVVLRNPWGENTRAETEEYTGQDNKQNGLLRVKLSDVARTGVDTLFVSDPPAPSTTRTALASVGGSSFGLPNFLATA